MDRLLGLCGLALTLLYPRAHAQVIEYESNGLKYQTLTKSGVTVMFAVLPSHLHQYTTIQVAVSNGSEGAYVIRPEDFTYVRDSSVTLRAASARTVIAMLQQKGSGSDVIKLVGSYEAGVYGNLHLRSTTNGYEQRRLAALSMGSTKLKAAATASALALVQTKLAPGESTDGAVFFPTEGKPLGPGRLVVRTNTDVFEVTEEQSGGGRPGSNSEAPAR
jgi:hypothetical protein